MRANRRFLGRTVQYMAEAGIRQFLDPGVVAIPDWRADSALDLNSAPTAMWGGVGRKS